MVRAPLPVAVGARSSRPLFGVGTPAATGGPPAVIAAGPSSTISRSGISATAVVPPYGDGRSITLIPCRRASCPTTNRPSCSVLAGLMSGGFASRSFSSASRCGVIPRPRSSISIANPLATVSPLTRTCVNGGESVVAFSISSASRWITSVTAEPASAARDCVETVTRA